jgi:hypothetical protein
MDGQSSMVYISWIVGFLTAAVAPILVDMWSRRQRADDVMQTLDTEFAEIQLTAVELAVDLQRGRCALTTDLLAKRKSVFRRYRGVDSPSELFRQARDFSEKSLEAQKEELNRAMVSPLLDIPHISAPFLHGIVGQLNVCKSEVQGQVWNILSKLAHLNHAIGHYNQRTDARFSVSDLHLQADNAILSGQYM